MFSLRSAFPLFVLVVSALTVPAQNQAPVVLSVPADISLVGAAGTAQTIALGTVFSDPDLLTLDGTQVRLVTSLGVMNLEMFDAEEPITVQNFLRYVADNRYANCFWHRSVPGFVLQTGGYTFVNNTVGQVVAFPAIVNEFHHSNVRGTIAMAKQASNPNSATSQWYVNLADNSANLDFQNGGFTVFGRAIEGGMGTADAITALPRVNAGPNFDSLPVQDYSGGSIQASNLIYLDTFATGPKMTFTASAADPSIANPVVQGLNVVVVAGHTGSTTITLTAQDFNVLSTQTSFQVSVLNPPTLVSIERAPGATSIVFRGEPNTPYAVEFCDSLPAPAWQPLAGGAVTSGRSGSFTVSDQSAGARRFYRARQVP